MHSCKHAHTQKQLAQHGPTCNYKLHKLSQTNKLWEYAHNLKYGGLIPEMLTQTTCSFCCDLALWVTSERSGGKGEGKVTKLTR